jgi:hypothetical protein
VIGGKVLAVSNTQFTIREGGHNAIEEGNVWSPVWGALDEKMMGLLLTYPLVN